MLTTLHSALQDTAEAVQGQLYPLINWRSHLSAATKIRLYKTIIKPTMLYATVWGSVARIRIQRLPVIQNKSLWMAIDALWYVRNSQIYRELNIPSALEIIRESASRMFAALPDNPNPLVTMLGDYDEEEHYKHKRPKTVLCEDQD